MVACCRVGGTECSSTFMEKSRVASRSQKCAYGTQLSFAVASQKQCLSSLKVLKGSQIESSDSANPVRRQCIQ